METIDHLLKLSSAGRNPFCEQLLKEIKQLLPLITHKDKKTRGDIHRTIGRKLHMYLLNDFHNIPWELRKSLCSVLFSLDQAIQKKVIHGINSEKTLTKLRTLQIMGSCDKVVKFRSAFLKLIKDKSKEIRATAIQHFGRIITPEDNQLILPLLSDDDPRVRANTIEALGHIPNKRFIPLFLRSRKDPNNRVRGNALKNLYEIGNTEVLDDLIDMIQSDDTAMKATALWVISTLNVSGELVEDVTGKCLLSENPMILRNAEKALQQISSVRAIGYLNYLGSL